MSGCIFAHPFPLSPSIGSIEDHLIVNPWPQPLGLVAWNHAGVVGISNCLCWHPHAVATGSHTEHSCPNPSLGKRQDWSEVGKVQFSCQIGANGARMGNGNHTTPSPHIFPHTLAVCLAQMGPSLGASFSRPPKV